MRLLDKSSSKARFAGAWIFSDDQETFERLIKLPDGILLVTGPTGSGKTTTPLRLSQLHQQTRPQDHHRGRADRVSDDRASIRCR